MSEKRGGDIYGEQRAHAVVRKALPHLDVGQLPKGFRMAQNLAGRDVRGRGYVGLGTHVLPSQFIGFSESGEH